ncbi:hypothetical protein AB0C98_41745 [Streptomyces sp. NPDC048558]|uniref:hypothetical protein n=1 Tax=Streptomyces sp. NPDC048558 TaxID=3155759 RepID=UPI0034198A82
MRKDGKAKVRTAVQRKQCGFCGKQLHPREGRGRRRDYCDAACRRRAQRARDAQRGQPLAVPSGIRMARELNFLASRLVAAERLRLPLETRLGLIDSILRQVERCAAAAVHETRQAGGGWDDVAAAAGMSAAQASARWDAPALRALFPPLQTADQRGAVQRLADALAYLQVRSGVSADEAAERAGLRVAHLVRVLEGACTPSWPELYTLVCVFAGNPEDLRVLWESASGTVRPPRLPAQGAAGYLAAALRGLHLAIGSPPLGELSKQALLPPECLTKVLAGRHTPPWSATARLVRALDGRIEDIEPLWEAVRRAAVDLHGATSSRQLGCPHCRVAAPDVS